MELMHLETFVCVFRTRSITGAARALHYSQPTVTSHVQTLERQLCTSLLERKSYGVAPTAAGHHVYAAAVVILRLVAGLREQVATVTSGGPPDVVIDITDAKGVPKVLLTGISADKG
jgi:LysR family nitrogen assimilation transcriptional regulator